MKSSKKLLSFFLAVVMVFSVLTVMASAYTVGPEVAGNINVKYTVEKVATAPETAAGSAEYTADNIYAVTVWMQCDSAVTVLTTPIHFNKTLFSPITLFDGEVTYPHGAGFSVDDYYSNMGEGAIYAYSLGDYMNNTGMYKANGDTATTKALAKCIGLGNSNSAGVSVTTELVSPDHSLYSKWGAGLPDDTGVLYSQIDVTGKAKTAYLNTIEGITTSKDWNRMITFYFEALSDDVEGAEFGVFTDDCFTVDGATDEYAAYFTAATTAIVGNPTKNVVANAKVAYVGHADTMAQWADQAAGKINVGLVGKFKVSDLPIAFDAKGTSENVTAVGAKVTINGTTEDKTTNFVYDVNGDGSEFWFRAVVEGVPYNSTEEISVVYYVVMDGRTYESAPVTTTGAAVYADAIANEMPEFGA
jgi:hypothetical protein